MPVIRSRLNPAPSVLQPVVSACRTAGRCFRLQEDTTLTRGARICFDHNDGRPLAVQFDKGVLLQGLWDACDSAGVELMTGMTAWDASDDGQAITIQLTCSGRRSSISARKALLADGVNSRMAEALGMNKGRTHFVTTQCMVYTLEGVKDPEPQAMKKASWAMCTSRARPLFCTRILMIRPGRACASPAIKQSSLPRSMPMPATRAHFRCT